MKRIILGGAALLLALTAAAYDSMKFTTTDGKNYDLYAKGLVVAVDGGTLSITNAKGESLQLQAADLAYMQFAVSAGVGNLPTLSDGAVTLHDLGGTPAGTYENLEAARAALPEGIYIVTDKNGNTSKILIAK